VQNVAIVRHLHAVELIGASIANTDSVEMRHSLSVKIAADQRLVLEAELKHLSLQL
jgi:hypothetical protein